MKLTAYRLNAHAQKIVSGRSQRAWMDQTRERFAYRCLPLTIANSMGWEILLPATIDVEWKGGADRTDITIECADPSQDVEKTAVSHFGRGILTFPIHYLFRTEPGVGLWVRGAPNTPKDGIVPLDGIIETDWLPFTFTMNWRFTRPGKVTFEKGEPICFVTPIAYRALEDIIPEIIPIAKAPEIAKQYESYRDARRSFNARLDEKEPEAIQQGWQKWYMRGENPWGTEDNPLHISKLRLAEPVNRDDFQDGAFTGPKDPQDDQGD